MSNSERFIEVYTRRLIAAITAAPAEYMDTVETAPALAVKMTARLATGGAMMSPTIRATCRELGIKATYGAICEYLGAGAGARQ